MLRIEREEKIIEIANYIIENEATVRSAGQHFKLSKSCIHRYMVKLLPNIDGALAMSVRNVLDINLEERHIRGGMSTKLKYEQQ